ncbi:MAG: GNAT family N-acetyltransferase [Roseburia sp.]|nr:GNAT family N-acetyltransferase [Ruminococcus sp.]MCM1155570.1 GNAT family N-acetyltransferase [Roseburia sp.]MCM1242405.1 GNAT family N-acetyltransferase [Roseburia sp.]
MSSIQSIYIKPLQLKEIKAIYKKHARRDFPAAELKPFLLIRRLWNNGCYKCYGFYEKKDGRLRAYAFTMAEEYTNMLLLDYFAVCENARGKGYGSQALALLKETCVKWDGMIVEVEDEDSTEIEEEKTLRRRRVAFYERNGVRMTNEKSVAFGVDYKLMVLPLGKEAVTEGLGKKLAVIYKRMLPDKVFQKAFRVR